MAEKPSHFYVGFAACGCGVRFIRDDESFSDLIAAMQRESFKDGLTVRRVQRDEAKRLMESECAHQESRASQLKGSKYVPIDYWDWCLLNSQDCETCEGTGVSPFADSENKCPNCKARYKLALSEDQAKWKKHTENPVFFVTAEAASKTAHYLPSC